MLLRLLFGVSAGILLAVGLAPLLKMLYLVTLSLMHEVPIVPMSAFDALLRSLLLALGVAAAATILGTLIALLLAKTDLPFTPLWLTLLSLPLLLPPDIIVLGWIDVLPSHGILRDLLYSPAGVAWIETTIFMPVAMLLGFFFLRRIPASPELAALLYTDEKGMLYHIDLRLLKPVVTLSFLLIFILTLGEYSVANALHMQLFSVEIFTRFSAFYDFEGTLVMSLPLILVAFAVIMLERIAIRHAYFGQLPQSAHHYRISLAPSSKNTFILLLAVSASMVTLLPLWGIIGTIDSTSQLWTALIQAGQPLLHSLLYAAAGGVSVTVAGLIVALTLYLNPTRYTRALEHMIFFFFILPAIVIAIALIGFYNTAATDWIYSSTMIILFAYTAKYLILPEKIISIRLQQLPKSLNEAALVHGATPLQTLRYILLPLLQSILIAALLVSALFCLRESGFAMLLLPPGESTLPVFLATRSANGDAGLIAAMALWMVIVVSVLLGLLLFLIKKYQRGAYDRL